MRRLKKVGVSGLLVLLCSWVHLAGAGMLPMSRDGVLAGSGAHHASGQAILRDGPYGAILALKGITVDEVPDGRVFLARGGDHRDGIEVGRLLQFSGDVSFKIPDGTDPESFDSVVIWCEKFQVEIGRAKLSEAGM
jgi:Electron transfer DM13